MRARAILGAAQALHRRSLAVRVVHNDERRYVSHEHTARLRAARPYVLVPRRRPGDTAAVDSEPPSEGEGGSEAERDVEADGAARVGDTAAAGASAPPRQVAKAKREWVEQNVTPLGNRPRFDDDGGYFVPQCGRLISGAIDPTHHPKLRASLTTCVAANPGVTEAQILERFWGTPACCVKGMLHSMVAAAELRCCRLPSLPPTTLFAADDVSQPLPTLCYFVEVGNVFLASSVAATSVSRAV